MRPGAQRAGAAARGPAVLMLAASMIALLPAPTAALPLTPAGPGETPAPPWRFVGLPNQTLPKTGFSVVEVDGARALRIESAGSYGNLVHPVSGPARQLAWRWRLERPLAAADLRRKNADDAALKVCAMFELDLDVLPFWERQALRLARTLSGEPLPPATLCYVWDSSLPAGTVLPNVYTGRMRWMVLQGAGAATGQWTAERRDVMADFRRVFGEEEAAARPTLVAIAVGADADNTGGRALGYVADPVLTP